MSRGVSGPRKPPSPAALLATRREDDVARYLVLRESLLALPGMVQRVVADGRGWAPAFCLGTREVARARLASRSARRDGLRLVLSLPGTLRQELARGSRLPVDLRRRIQRADGDPPRCSVPVTSDDELLLALDLALRVASRLAVARHRTAPAARPRRPAVRK